MGTARRKLNVAYFNGSLFVSVVIALIAENWAIFWIALVITLVGGFSAGNIRLRAGRR